jgi:hypothetical protein
MVQAEVQMSITRQTRSSHRTELLTRLDALADVNKHPVQMRVKRIQPVIV